MNIRNLRGLFLCIGLEHFYFHLQQEHRWKIGNQNQHHSHTHKVLCMILKVSNDRICQDFPLIFTLSSMLIKVHYLMRSSLILPTLVLAVLLCLLVVLVLLLLLVTGHHLLLWLCLHLLYLLDLHNLAVSLRLHTGLDKAACWCC